MENMKPSMDPNPEQQGGQGQQSHEKRGRPVEQVKDKTREIGENLKDLGYIVKEAINEKIHELREDATRYGNRGRDRVGELRDEVEGYVEERPMKAVMIAAGIGFLLGVVWRR